MTSFKNLASHQAGFQAPTEVIASAPPAYNSQVEGVKKWQWNTLVWSVLSMMCCQVLGLAATIFAVLAYVDHKVGDHARSNLKRNNAKILAIAAAIIGAIFIGLMITLAVYTSTHDITDWFPSHFGPRGRHGRGHD